MALRHLADSGYAKIRDSAAEAMLFRRRAAIALGLVVVAVLALAGRMAYLQVVNHDHFTTLSESNRVRIQPLPPTRGLIFDRNGVLLADNLSAYRLVVTPDQVEDLDATLAALGERVDLDESDIARFRRAARRNPYNGVPLRFRLEDREVARLAVDLHRLPGVEIRADLARVYPLGAHAVHVVGYVGRIDEDELRRVDATEYSGSSHIGKTGAEKAFEHLLHGRVGVQQVETNAQGRVLRVVQSTPPVPGKNVYLTIDSRLQAAAEAALGAHDGAVVAIDPNNGEVLALVSEPGYDPNLFVNGIDPETFAQLNRSRARPLFNRALRGTYPPGSTLKPFVALAGLEQRVIDRGTSTYCPGFYRLPNHHRKFRDWKRGGHGHTNVHKAIAESCDVFFYDLSVTLGIDRIHDFLAQFGLGRRTGVDLTGEKGGLVPSVAWKRRVYDEPWYTGETLIAGIGQGYMLATPLQLAHATAVLARRGAAFRPKLLFAVESQDGGWRDRPEPTPIAPPAIADAGNWDHVVASMTQVVHGRRGTARAIGETATYRIAGKTGTAQVYSLAEDEEYDAEQLARHLHDHALFIAFAPAEDPRIAVSVVAEHGGGGSSVAAPIARRVLDAYLRHP